ncbi:LysR substrate-binding domain-containing protein [Pigmentiphaga soli]|uniref:LysR substrate-binding domain-containing protein n=2 Tax=Pigmentiphaga soli TaxID=1007095 RepID=A0ABP8GCK1_9BURK
MTVAEELHFRKAAERLHMTQPPLSMHIKQLEEWIGVDLFSRTTRSVRLTPAGMELKQRVARLLAAFDEMTEAVRHVGRGASGSLNLGFSASAAFDVLPRLLAMQRSRYPQVELELREETTAALFDSLHARAIDAALLRASPAAMVPEFSYTVAAREPMVVALPLAHRLARLAEVPVERLVGEPMVGFSANGAHYFRHLVQQLFEAHGVQPLIVHEGLLPGILALVEAGVGAALVPASMARLRPGELAYRPLADGCGLDICTLYCAWRKGDFNPVVQNFVGVVDASGLAQPGAVRLPGGPPAARASMAAPGFDVSAPALP